MDETALLRGMILDQARIRETEYRLTHTYFLTPAQRVDAQQIARKEQLYPGCFFYGGYPDAERTVLFLAPDYLELRDEEELERYFRDAPEACPLCVVHAVRDPFNSITHRDYLGSLLGLGIKREMIGDLIVSDKGCEILVLRRIAAYITENFRSAGHASLSCTVGELSSLKGRPAAGTRRSISLKSPRLDAVVSAAFGIPRTQASALIARGTVAVCSVPATKPEKQIHPGDSVTLRGKGKCRILEIAGTTKSGRILLRIETYGM